MTSQMEKLQQLRDLMMNYGLGLIQGLVVIIVGFLVLRVVVRALRKLLNRVFPNSKYAATITNVVGILLGLVVIVAASVQAGLPVRPILRLLVVIALAAGGVVVLLRPMVPDLPFKIGNTVKVGGLLGKVEGITFLNTRMRTFDGKTIFVPNRQILDDIVINYHYTPTRRIKINLGIRYDSDLVRAKQILEELMIQDPRVKVTPRPVVYVLALTLDKVELGARCWVPNMKYWVTKCDLLEKIKLAFDREGIRFAHAQVDVYHRRAEPDAEPVAEEDEWA